LKAYMERKKQNDEMEELKNETIFGLMGGILLVLVGALNWLTAQDFWETVCLCAAALGLLFFVLGIVVPAALKYPYKVFRFWGNLVGKVIFAVVLAALYAVLIFPVGLLQRRKREAQGCCSWDKTPPELHSAFVDIMQTDNPKAKSGRTSYFGILYQLFSGLVTNRRFILIPVVVILVIVGLVLFFASSNVMTAFIYTLF